MAFRMAFQKAFQKACRQAFGQKAVDSTAEDTVSAVGENPKAEEKQRAE